MATKKKESTKTAPTNGQVKSKRVKSNWERILQAPLRWEQVEFKPGSKSRKPHDKMGDTFDFMTYLTARTVQDRLDEAFGPIGWSTDVFPVEGVKGAWKCVITVTIDGKTASKADVAQSTDIEPVKGGASSAMKRTASHWGIGRELYRWPRIKVARGEGTKNNYPAPYPNVLKEAFHKLFSFVEDGTVGEDDTVFISKQGNLMLLEMGQLKRISTSKTKPSNRGILESIGSRDLKAAIDNGLWDGKIFLTGDRSTIDLSSKGKAYISPSQLERLKKSSHFKA